MNSSQVVPCNYLFVSEICLSTFQTVYIYCTIVTLEVTNTGFILFHFKLASQLSELFADGLYSLQMEAVKARRYKVSL